MATRLFLMCVFTTAIACTSSKTGDKQSDMSGGGRAAASTLGRDAVERGLLSLGIEGRVYRYDLNEVADKLGRLRVHQVHLLSDMLLLEGGGAKPALHALARRGLEFKWVSRLWEPTRFKASENADTVLLVSLHYLHAIEKQGGLGAMQFLGGELDGIRRPPHRFPYRPTGSAAAQHDTVYIPTLGSADSNKNLESISLVNGSRGWGYRTSAEIFAAPAVGGSAGDPKLYFVTRTGHVTCMDAVNYGYVPRGVAWEHLLEAGVSGDFFLTADAKGYVGALYLADVEGKVYCLDRITGERRWSNATGRTPAGGPQVFGDLCVMRMTSGLMAFDRDNVLYELSVKGNGNAESLWVRTGKGASVGGIQLAIQNAVLHAVGSDEARFRVNGGAETSRAALYNGDSIAIGDTLVTVSDNGSDPLWADLEYDRVVAKHGDKLVVSRGTSLYALDAWTGEQLGAGVDMSAARFIPSNTRDGNIFAVGGDAVVYALFSR